MSIQACLQGFQRRKYATQSMTAATAAQRGSRPSGIPRLLRGGQAFPAPGVSGWRGGDGCERSARTAGEEEIGEDFPSARPDFAIQIPAECGGVDANGLGKGCMSQAGLGYKFFVNLIIVMGIILV